MVTCELDKEISGEILGWKLPAWQALLLHRVLPSCGGLLLYLSLICFDLSLVYENFNNGHNGVGVFCVVLITLPSLLSLIFTLASPPPGLQTDLTAFTIQIKNSDLKWIFVQFFNCLLFPIATIGRYCYLIFWWIEAVCASYIEDDERTREAVLLARAPSPIELYLFLQSFVHSAPLAILNILDIMANVSNPAFEKVTIQAVSIIVSTLRMASTATVYRRFEREKLCGRKYPWRTNSEVLLENAANEIIEKQKNVQEEHMYEPLTKKRSLISQKSDEDKRLASEFIQFSPHSSTNPAPFFEEYGSESDVSSGYISPVLKPGQASPTNSLKQAFDSDDEYVRPVSIIDRVAPRRRDMLTIERVNITPPPVMEAPRPGVVSVWAEKIVENAEAIPSWLSAPTRRRHYNEVIPDEPDIPVRVPRSYMRGLEPQDASAALVNFLGWYAFFVSRLLSIAAFINFLPFAAIIVLFCHYQVMLLLLIVPQAPTIRRVFYLFLAFVFLFCLMEFKVRFRHVRVWHVFWIIVCTVEIVIFTSLWSSIDNSFNDWWRLYVVKVIIGSMLLSYMCFLVYFVILKPRETIVYIKKTNTKTSDL